MRRGGRRLLRLRAGLLAAAAAALAVLSHARAADVVFRVPEVLVRHTAAPRAVGTGVAPATSPPHELRLRYEEYFIEHDVSTTDARLAAKALDLDQVPATLAGCGHCTRRELDYCVSRVLADHCCCERHPMREPFPWLPHTCYVGPRRCRPQQADCAQYARLRDCCCTRQLAERWKSILSGSPPVGAGAAMLLVAGTLVATRM